MRIVFHGLALSCLLLIPAVTRAQQDSSTQSFPLRDHSALADSLREYAIRMGELLRSMNTEAVLDLYGERARFVHIETGAAISWPRLASMIRTYFATAPSNPVSVVGEPYVLLMDRDNAVVYVEHRMEASPGRPAHSGIWTGVLRRTPAGWKIVHSHSSDGET